MMKAKLFLTQNKMIQKNYVEFLNEVKEHGYKEVKCLGFKFYNTEPRTESEFAIDFQTRMPS